jgi:lipoyl(octanoyl) transferase
MQKVLFEDLGSVNYKEAWEYQETLLNNITTQKKEQQGRVIKPIHHLLFCQHPHVYTLGKSGKDENLLINETQLNAKQIDFYRINRGGDITYHGPGQIVGYPILDLDWFFHDIHKYLRYLEEAVILTLNEYGIKAGRIEKLTGVWVGIDDMRTARKICAFGVRCSRWVTMHGLALNVNTDLSYYDNIVPCGINDKAVTSMQAELGKKINLEEVKNNLKINLSKVFDFILVNS